MPFWISSLHIELDKPPRHYGYLVGRSIMAKLRSMPQRLERPTGDHWRARAEKNVFKLPGPAVNARDLGAHGFSEYERGRRKK